MFFPHGHLELTAINRWDQLDGIGNHVAEEHIRPSKYDTRQTVVSRICDALEKLRIISICGNGATSLAKKLAIFVKQQGSFPSVATVSVSRDPNSGKIRKGILQQIGRTRISNCLLILDGFWWELENKDFQTIGIPSPGRKFGIVFVSRKEDVCKKIGSHQIHHVNFLEDGEAWDLFREVAGKSIVDLDIEEMARMIVEECDGFRIAILTIASTLKDKPRNVWEYSLARLQNLNGVQNISDMEKVFAWMRLSYHYIDQEAQRFFEVCSLFPEDFNVPIEDFVLFGKGLELFENVDSMHLARDRVESIIRKLKNLSFLVDGDGDGFVKVHDMLREFGASWSKWKRTSVVRYEDSLKEWPLKRTKYQNCRAISLTCKTIAQHPVDLVCPKLRLLQLCYGSNSAQLPNRIFEGLENLKVLSLNIPSLSQPLTVLTKLRTLCITESVSDSRYMIRRPRIGDLIGYEMKDLEIFSFSTARPYREFPMKIGLFHNLRYLRFNVERLKYIPSGVLSKLAKLEELYLPRDFISWGCKEGGGQRMNASLGEIESLQLTALGIGVPKGANLEEKLVKNLTRFHVFIGSHVSPEYEFGTGGNSKKLLEVFDVDAHDFGMSWISRLVRKSESLKLKQVRNLKSIISRKWQELENKNIEFPRWTKICISDCNEVEYIAAGRIPWTSFSQLESLKLFGLCNLKEIWHGLYLSKIQGPCFGNLAEIQIMLCRKLKYVFPLSVATELRQLQSLQICFCDEMKEIFYGEQKNNDGNQVARRNASKGELQLRDPTVETASTAKDSIRHKSKLFSLTSNSITKRLLGRGKQPRNVTRHKQAQMEENSEIIFPQLRTMELAYMDKLRIFYNGNHHAILLPSLESLSIFHCSHLEAFSYGLLETPSLQQIQINGNKHSVTEDVNAVVKNLNRSRIDQAKADHEIQVEEC